MPSFPRRHLIPIGMLLLLLVALIAHLQSTARADDMATITSHPLIFLPRFSHLFPPRPLRLLLWDDNMDSNKSHKMLRPLRFPC